MIILDKIKNLLSGFTKLDDIPNNSSKYMFYVQQVKQLKQQNIIPIKFDEFIKTINNSKLINVFLDCLLNIKEQFIYKSDIHGINHNIRVALYSFYLCNKLNLDEIDTKIALYGALYHDIGRQNDCEDRLHGRRSAILLDKLNLQISETEKQILKTIITCHSLPDAEFDSVASQICQNSYQRAKVLFTILKDADGLDRVRLEYPFIKIEFIRNEAAKRLIELSYLLEYNFEVII